jgi:hypothetical protein
MLLIKHKNGVVPHSRIHPASGLDEGQGGVTVWYQSQGSNVEPIWARQVMFGPRF